MKRNRLIAALLCAVLLVTLLPAAALAATAEIGKLISATGDVYLVTGDAMEKAAEGASLYDGVTVMTGETANAKLDLGKGRYAALDARSAVRLTRDGDTLITEHLAGNVFHNIVEKQAENAYAVKMNVFNLSVLGTSFFTSTPAITGDTPPTGEISGMDFRGGAQLLEGVLDVDVQDKKLASMIPGDKLNVSFNGNDTGNGTGALYTGLIEQSDITNLGPFMLGEAAGALGVGAGDTEGGDAAVLYASIKRESNENRRRALEERGTVPVTNLGNQDNQSGVRFVLDGDDVWVVPLGSGDTGDGAQSTPVTPADPVALVIIGDKLVGDSVSKTVKKSEATAGSIDCWDTLPPAADLTKVTVEIHNADGTVTSVKGLMYNNNGGIFEADGVNTSGTWTLVWTDGATYTAGTGEDERTYTLDLAQDFDIYIWMDPQVVDGAFAGDPDYELSNHAPSPGTEDASISLTSQAPATENALPALMVLQFEPEEGVPEEGVPGDGAQGDETNETPAAEQPPSEGAAIDPPTAETP